ncbi:MAG: hypothetical protein ACLQU2_02470 [Candidatus Binataceae bacterium]
MSNKDPVLFGEIWPLIVRRVGVEPENRLRWLLNFINSGGADGDARIINAEVQFFLQTAPSEKGPTLSEGELKEVALELKNQLSNFLVASVSFIVTTRGWVRHSAYRSPFGAVQKTRGDKFSTIVALGDLQIGYECQNPDDAFKMRSFELITRHADVIGSCKECDKFFVRSRTDQEYCSTKCSQAVRTRRFLAKQDKKTKGKS